MQFVNDSEASRRCAFTFVVDVHINRTWDPKREEVFSPRGLQCGLPIDPQSEQGYCFWHMSQPEKVRDPELRDRLERAVRERVYLGEAFLAGGIQGAVAGDNPPLLDLTGTVLNGAYLAGAYMEGTILQRAQLNSADLRSAWLIGADLREAELRGAYLQGADCHDSQMAGSDLWAAQINEDTEFTGVSWGKRPVLGSERAGEHRRAEWSYRMLKQHYQGAGEYRQAGEFYFREMESVRKQKGPIARFLWLVFFKSTMGYGERPSWTLAWMFAVIVFWGFVVFPLSGIATGQQVSPPQWPPTPAVMLNSLSLSVITFATLGYGNRYPASGWGELLAGVEALLGMLLTSLFLVAFGKKVFRS